jgi:hypothetical protein
VFNAGGRFVAEALNEDLPAGISLRSWNPSAGLLRDLASGAYFLRLDAGAEQSTRMFILRKWPWRLQAGQDERVAVHATAVSTPPAKPDDYLYMALTAPQLVF